MADHDRTEQRTDEHTDGPGTESGDTMRTDTMRTDTGQIAYTDVTPAPGPLHTDVITTDDPAPPARRRGPDPLALVVGLATLVMAVFAFAGELPDLSGFDPRWLLAGGAVAVGLVLLVGNLRNRSGGRRGRS